MSCSDDETHNQTFIRRQQCAHSSCAAIVLSADVLKLTLQWRIQDGAFGANAAPPPSRNCIQDRDTLIEQSITLIKQSQRS